MSSRGAWTASLLGGEYELTLAVGLSHCGGVLSKGRGNTVPSYLLASFETDPLSTTGTIGAGLALAAKDASSIQGDLGAGCGAGMGAARCAPLLVGGEICLGRGDEGDACMSGGGGRLDTGGWLCLGGGGDACLVVGRGVRMVDTWSPASPLRCAYSVDVGTVVATVGHFFFGDDPCFTSFFALPAISLGLGGRGGSSSILVTLSVAASSSVLEYCRGTGVAAVGHFLTVGGGSSSSLTLPVAALSLVFG
jgi:hypothetical protein